MRSIYRILYNGHKLKEERRKRKKKKKEGKKNEKNMNLFSIKDQTNKSKTIFKKEEKYNVLIQRVKK